MVNKRSDHEVKLVLVLNMFDRDVAVAGCVFEIDDRDKYPTLSDEGKPPPTPGNAVAAISMVI